MNDEKIKVKVTDPGKTMDVVVLTKRAQAIQIVLGEGVHSVKCDLAPTRNGNAYVGTAMGRELPISPPSPISKPPPGSLKKHITRH